jgi:antitoxin ParD1/3/4
MTMIRKQIYIAPEHEAKLKRLAQGSGRSEAEIIREALEAIPEETDPVLNALAAQGLIVAQQITVTRAASEELHRAYLEQIGDRQLGLTQTVLDERARQP